MRTHTATPEDLAAHELALVNLDGAEAYAKAGEWIVKLNLDGTPGRDSASNAIVRLGLGSRLKRTLGKPDLALIDLPQSVSYNEVQHRLRRLRLGAYIEPNVVIVPSGERFPDDASFEEQWGLHNTGQMGGTEDADIDAPEAWDVTTGTGNVVMAVFDGGIDATHPDLAGNMWTNPGEIPGNGEDDDGNGYPDDVHGFDFLGNNGSIEPDEHGSHVAGIMGAVGNNGTGVTGVNWTAQIMSIQIFWSRAQCNICQRGGKRLQLCG